MNKVQEFFNDKFGSVRTATIKGQVYFVGLDIAKSLGYSNERKAIITHCKSPLKHEIDVTSQNSTSHKARNSQVMLMISKSDIYRLIVRSKLESAEEFESWIFEKILPTIEKTGAYIEDEQKTVDYYFSQFSDEIKLSMVKELEEKNKALQEFYDNLINTDGLMSMNTVSKELNGIGLKTLYAYLRSKGIVFYKDDINIPYQRFMDQKLFKVKETPCADGKTRPATYATKKGLEYIRKLLHKDGFYDEVTL